MNKDRKLTAIMFLDMVGYTAMMQEDEEKTQKAIQHQRDIVLPIVESNGGIVLRYIGDGTLCTFESAINSVNAAVKIQNALLEDPIMLRIGIHIGDIVSEKGDIYGDGVNVASRLEPLALPGGVCVSETVYDNIKNQSGIDCISMGRRTLKIVKRPMEVYALEGEGLASPSALNKFNLNMKWIAFAAVVTIIVIVGLNIDISTKDVEAEKDINNLSIAVLPFANMSSDPENEFFSDGITEEILMQLSKIKSLAVISRTSIMQYKNTTKSLREIGKELGVANILEGSVRREGNRVRITGQLIIAKTDKHIWADTYDRDLDNIFAIQSDVALKIANALEASLAPEEEKRINKKPTNNLEAYDLYLKGNVLYNEYNNYFDRKILEAALTSYEKAVAVDSNFVIALSRLAIAHLELHGRDRTDERLAKAKRAIDKAWEIDSEHSEVLRAKGYYHYRGYLNYDEALKYLTLALEKQPNNSDVLATIGYVYRRKGDWNDAIASMKRAVDLDPLAYVKTMDLADMYITNRMWKQAKRYCDRTLLLNPKAFAGYYFKMLLAILSQGDLKDRRMILEEAKENIDPNRFISFLGRQYLLERKFTEALNTYERGNRKWYRSKAYLHFKLGHLEKANFYYDSLRVEAEESVIKYPKKASVYSKFGVAYAGLGRKVEAIENGLKAVELLPLSKDAFDGLRSIRYLAEIYTMVGENDNAIDQLELLLSIPSYITEYSLRLDPKWDPLREHPRFIKLIAN